MQSINHIIPQNFDEWKNFLLSISPLLGYWFFREDPKLVILPLISEIYVLFFIGMIRLSFYMPTAFVNIQDIGKEREDFKPGIPWINWTVTILVLGPLLIWLNYLFFDFFMGFLKPTLLPMGEGEISYEELLEGLEGDQKYIFDFFVTLATIRYIPGLVRFFKNKIYKDIQGLEWMFWGMSPVTNSEPILFWSNHLIVLILFFASMISIMNFFPWLTPVFVYPLKSVFEMNIKRLYSKSMTHIP